MKRNHLVRDSQQTNIFNSSSTRLGKRRHILSLSLFALASILITSMVLATSQPVLNSSQTKIIDLPNLPVAMQIASIDNNQTNTLTLPDLHIKDNNPVDISKIATTTKSINNEINPTATELAFLEQQALDESHALIHANSIDISTEQDQEQIKAISSLKLYWRELAVKSGDNLSLLFPRVGLSDRDVYNVAQLGKDITPLLKLKPGQIMRFGFLESDKTQLKQIELALDPINTLIITNSDDGYKAITHTRDVETKQVHASGTIVSSLFGAGKEAGLSDKLIMELAYIFGWDIDFALDLRENDRFTVIYNEKHIEGEKFADGDIVAAEFVNQGKSFKAVHYIDDNGQSRFYTPSGESMRKAFNRTPVHFSRISSKFNPNRKHPKLKGVTRPHQGVDYAASTGTPIMATGDGKVQFVGTKGGYGRTVILSHGGKYTTLYAHMSRFAKSMKPGKRVNQGDIIGYIGSSGLATGPHLHYEFRVNGVHRNPLTVTLPKAESLPKKYKADFEKKAQPLLAQLDSIGTKLALTN
ncbi:MAG: peptidoglycan DD-metalloendopeptidase family protein [Gammaproteobacteria bacterium]|nr:peptidoglycan DD-metalloendopeptidase family protein [Gammaproteobacteria bacterium]